MTANITPILAAAALAALACTSARTPSGEQAAAALGSGRTLVAPLNLGLRAPVELKDVDEPVWHELLRYFQAQDRQVILIAPVDAELVWMDTIAELEQSGAAHDLPTASAHFARRLGEQLDYELLLMPSLVLRSARVQGRLASWDGVRRRLRVRTTPSNGPIIEIGLLGNHPAVWGLTGRVAAASFHIAVLTSDGRFLHQGLGGLDLIQEATLDRRAPRETWQLVLREAPFADVESLRQGIALAFERELPRSAYSW
jgi:hypothetical protein